MIKYFGNFRKIGEKNDLEKLRLVCIGKKFAFQSKLYPKSTYAYKNTIACLLLLEIGDVLLVIKNATIIFVKKRYVYFDIINFMSGNSFNPTMVLKS